VGRDIIDFYYSIIRRVLLYCGFTYLFTLCLKKRTNFETV